MQLTKDKVGTVNYTLKDKDGEIIDETQDGSFAYLHGASNIIPGLENELEGKETGYKNSIVIEPKDAYGERNLEQIQRVPLSMFPDDVEISEGMQFEAQSDDGAPDCCYRYCHRCWRSYCRWQSSIGRYSTLF